MALYEAQTLWLAAGLHEIIPTGVGRGSVCAHAVYPCPPAALGSVVEVTGRYAHATACGWPAKALDCFAHLLVCTGQADVCQTGSLCTVNEAFIYCSI